MIGACGIPSMVADLSIRGVWQTQTAALFVLFTLMLHHIHTGTLPLSFRRLKRGSTVIQQKHCVPVYLVASIDEVLVREAECFIQLLANKLANKWRGKNRSEVAGLLRARVSFAILRALVCL